MTKEYDLVILGGGTGGYVAAIHASKSGMNVAVVEDDNVGGTCLHKGCIPSKALLKSAQKYRETQHIADYGISVQDIKLDFEQVQRNKSDIVQSLHTGVKALLKKANVDVYHGFGRILGPSIFSPMPGTISIEHNNGEENTMIVPKHVLIATGSHPRALPDLPFDGEFILSSDHALELDELPESIIIIGGGVIGIEWASLLTDFGVTVTVIETADTILPLEDNMVQQEMKKQLTKRGVLFKTGVTVDTKNIHKKNDAITIQIKETSENVTANKLLVSIGREANINQIGLSNTEIIVEDGFIKTNHMYQTKEDHIYAIGDCIGGMQLAHVASKEGITAVDHMIHDASMHINHEQIPSCIYSHPEAAKIGLTEQQAIEAGYSIKVGKMPFQAIGKAHVNGYKDGFIKIITDESTNDILGVHIVGDNATELIAEASLAKMLNADAWEISQTIHPHPTLSEIFGEAALAVDKKQIHG